MFFENIGKPRRALASCLMSAPFVLTCLIGLSLGAANAADISVRQSPRETTQIVMSGEFIPADLDRFLAASANTSSAVVRFDSLGGHLQTGLLIGLVIRQRGYTTAVGAGSRCFSSCALAWLAGRTRLKDVSSKVGFHAASDAHRAYSQEGTELMRAYARNLGLSWEAAKFLTEAPPDKMRLLTASAARAMGVNVISIGDGQR